MIKNLIVEELRKGCTFTYFNNISFISLNLYRTKVHLQYHEHIVIYHICNISPFLMKHNVFGYQKTIVEVLNHTVHQDTPVYNYKLFAHYICSYICISNTF